MAFPIKFKVTVFSFLTSNVEKHIFEFSGLTSCEFVVAKIVDHFETGQRAISIYDPSQGLPYSGNEVHDITKTLEAEMKPKNVVLFLVDHFQDIAIGKTVLAEFKTPQDHGVDLNNFIQLCYLAPVSVVRSLVYLQFVNVLNEIKHIHFSFYLDQNTLHKGFEKERTTLSFFEYVPFNLLSTKERTFFKVSFQPLPVVVVASPIKLDQVPTSELIQELKKRAEPHLAEFEKEIATLRQELFASNQKISNKFKKFLHKCSKSRSHSHSHSKLHYNHKNF